MEETKEEYLGSFVSDARAGEIFDEIVDAFQDIPFENSTFRTDNFVVKASVTPRRAYRAIGLRMMSKIEALKSARFEREKSDLEIERKRRKIRKLNSEKPEDYDIDVRLLEIEIEKDLGWRSYAKKLVKDASRELSHLYGMFKRLPRYTRDQFEEAEAAYFTETLSNRLLGAAGAGESVKNMLLTGDPIDVLTVQRPIGMLTNASELLGGLARKASETDHVKLLSINE